MTEDAFEIVATKLAAERADLLDTVRELVDVIGAIV